MNQQLGRLIAVTSGLLLPMLLCGCTTRMSYREALEAVGEAAFSTRGESLTEDIIEISTDFTIGEAVEDAAAELAAWLESQIDCSTVTLDGPTITVDFGTLDDQCIYNSHTYAGLWAVTIQSNLVDEVVVDHEWTALTDGEVTLDGTAQVTWSSSAHSRHVVHDVTWVDEDGTVEASGDRLQELIDPVEGISAGIVVNGDRDWNSGTGEWSLDIDAVEMRGMDPVPQAGVYTLTTPALKVATLTFTRLDANTIECVLASGSDSWTFEISSTGVVEEA